MRLSPPGPVGPPPADVAAALVAARDRLGHRPAVTVLGDRGREEQGVASLAQWAAKGAHLLEADLLLEPGDRLVLLAPVSWPAAAVCLAAWWAGITVSLDPGDPDAEVAVVHTDHEPPAGAREVVWLGDAVDGAPEGSLAAAGDGEAWSHAVQTFPDQPPTPRAAADLLAIDPGPAGASTGGGALTQDEALRQAAGDGSGTLGLDLTGAERAGTPATADALVAVALRPLVAGRPTVVLRAGDRGTAAGEKVTTWR